MSCWFILDPLDKIGFGTARVHLIELTLRTLSWSYAKALRRMPLAEWGLHTECRRLLDHLKKLDPENQYHSSPGTFRHGGSRAGNEALNICAAVGHTDKARWALSYGADINSPTTMARRLWILQWTYFRALMMTSLASASLRWSSSCASTGEEQVSNWTP